ncbi:hypothetical protein A7985_22965 [Pseudoalteromonas luteoviolacea]|uniref:Uncharacterized protein n=1 Tax=Pseudoalteromonas luteoviolacea TaxID=43657 RepID=A0A1C0TJU4_9GAMM|nr:hypothetical protein [Pseudoalteromonas luteoviolacea]MBQ4813886.1 hypothetical protein [Pseudoalteromonas luteoviolacea]OCQ18750.1 hypothetical protein A7985_22965 [Pseudoalteromonas luteoviolacea]
MNKVFAVLALGLSVSANANAKSVDIATLESCTTIQNALKRLVCFDDAMAGNKVASANTHVQHTASSTVTSKVTATPVAPVVPAQTAEQKFGLENKVKEKLSDIENLTLKVVKLKVSSRGVRTFTLENDHVWKQIGSDSFYAKVGDKITIKRASFNSYLMSKAGSNRSIRVKRLQ